MRLQFNSHFTLRHATELVPYLSDLGVSHVYASPLLKALPGSTHGYDVCDFSQLDPRLGTEADLEAFIRALRERGMALVLDVVPNHMGIGGRDNPWWWDVLERGPASRFASYFDIDWDSADPRLRGKVLVPILGDRYQRVLETGELRLTFDQGAFTFRYLDHSFPVCPGSLLALLRRAAERCGSGELLAWSDPVETKQLGSPAEQLGALCRQEPAIAAALQQTAEELNADLAALDALLQQQHYRLTFWRRGDRELNYRRFFNILTLAALRAEDERVFADSHALVRGWLEAGWLDGLRVDHVDGLRDPEGYLQRLRRLAPRAWIVLEKILAPGEALPPSWPVAGTTGYDFLNRVGGLFIDPAGEQSLTDFYARFTGQPTDYPAIVSEKKRLVLRQLLVAEVERLSALLLQICARHWRYRDFARAELETALIAVAAAFPVYRTYVHPDTGQVSEADAAWIARAAAQARAHAPGLDPTLFEFLTDLLLLRLRGQPETEFVSRFQQLTGPAMAKGGEDTAFYCFNRLIALNEVGGGPDHFGLSVDQFHRACLEAQARWPTSMLATSTHDTKQSEDVRARLSLLSEIPDRWSAAVRRWSALNERHRRNDLPGRNMEYRFYQTLVGAWPLELSRARTCAEKAACEAKVRTTWTRRNPRYDRALRGFVTGALGDPAFKADVAEFMTALIDPGYVNALGQVLIKLTAPGVPDLYQGTELWDWSLMDPDNRRPVDFGLRRQLLDELPRLSLEAVWQRRGEGLPKLWLIHKALGLRRRHPEWFDPRAAYTPLAACGAKAQHLLAFQREGAITAVPRLILRLQGDWADTALELPRGDWRNELTGDAIAGPLASVADLLSRFPVALLSRKENE